MFKMLKKTNPFKKIIDEAVLDAINMIEFSNKLRQAMELSHDDVADALNRRVRFTVGEYIIQPKSIHIKNSWNILLIAQPNYIPEDIGFSNIKHKDFPVGWTYIPQGTGTIIYPNKDIQDRILVEIRRTING